MQTMERKKPLILLDIDGVINTDGEHESGYWNDNTAKLRSVNKFCYSPSLIAKINEWGALADIKWLTDWNERANSIIAPAIGLELLSLGRNENNISKQDAFIFNAAKDNSRLIIWIDDELKSFKENNDKIEHTYYNNFLRYNNKIFTRPNTVFISPAIGLNQEYADVIDKILANPEAVEGQCVYHFQEGQRLYVRR